jgi:hypothetical protein
VPKYLGAWARKTPCPNPYKQEQGKHRARILRSRGKEDTMSKSLETGTRKHSAQIPRISGKEYTVPESLGAEARKTQCPNN